MFFGRLAELGRKVVSTIAFFSCAGLILLIVGAAFLQQSTVPDRENKINQYNKTVDEWKSTHFSAFSGQVFYLTTSSDNSSTLLVADSEADIIADDKVRNSWTYDRLLYRQSANLLSSGYYRLQLSPGEDVTLSVSTFPATKTGLADLGNCRQSDYECDRITNSDQRRSCFNRPLCSTRCSSYGGSWDGSRCNVVGYLRKLCILVEQVNGTWRQTQLAGRGMGCLYESYSKAFNIDAFSPGVYSTDAGSMDVQIRHVKDPFVIASDMTNGSFQFGLSQEQKATIGIVMLCIGGAIIGLLILGTILLITCFKRVLKPSIIPYAPQITSTQPVSAGIPFLNAQNFGGPSPTSPYPPAQNPYQSYPPQSQYPNQPPHNPMYPPPPYPPNQYQPAPYSSYPSGPAPSNPGYPNYQTPSAMPEPHMVQPNHQATAYGAPYGTPYAYPPTSYARSGGETAPDDPK